ncbi:PEP-CTERM sorting domain-containing protein [Roseateles sp. DC23W]|uniref:PEP-CTERM sorting domain-containing protein n=1 Tax=Pelomonas dachongensis TaxID=3299029 RepID=A0ABW7EXS3_9BURK
MQIKPTALAAVLLATASLAQANTTHESFSDVTGSASFDGWNQLNRSGLGCADSTCSTAKLVAGITANVAGSGDAVFKRDSGDHYPAGFGLYGGNSVLSFIDTTLVGNLGTLVFQGIVNDFSGAGFGLTLSYNGGTQALAASNVSSVLTGGVADYYRYTFDLSGLGAVNSYSLSLNAGFSQMLAFQVDQVATAPVPEPSTYALMAGGLGLVGWLARRRKVTQA